MSVIGSGNTKHGAVNETSTFYRLASENKPSDKDGVSEGDNLIIVDTKDIYIFYKGVWYLQ